MLETEGILNCFKTVHVLPSLSPRMAGKIPVIPIAMHTTIVGHDTELKLVTEGLD
jgi:hypothetical protein